MKQKRVKTGRKKTMSYVEDWTKSKKKGGEKGPKKGHCETLAGTPFFKASVSLTQLETLRVFGGSFLTSQHCGEDSQSA